MSRALLDINVLLALVDGNHVDHGRAWDWLDAEIVHGWASCPVTENGFVRTISQPRYPDPVPTSQALALLRQPASPPHHQFWPCDVSLLDDAVLDSVRVHGPKQVTDLCLVALAVKNDGRFVTFDRSVARPPSLPLGTNHNGGQAACTRHSGNRFS